MLMPLPNAEKDRGQFQGEYYQGKEQLQSMATDTSLGYYGLPAKSTCPQTLSIGALRNTTSMWITAGDHLGPGFSLFSFTSELYYVHVCGVIGMHTCTVITHCNDIHVMVVSC